jgi:branched-chain amino acid transport system permease protein
LLRGLLGGRLAGIHLIVYGVILILMMRLAPRGLWGLLSDAMARRPK